MSAIAIAWDTIKGGTKEFVGERGPWHASDMLASEDEVFDFLYGLVRILKPLDCFESGSYHGGATVAIARALRENGVEGFLVSCETDPVAFEIVSQATKDLPVDIRSQPGEIVAATASWDFAFLDGGGCDERFKQAKALNR